MVDADEQVRADRLRLGDELGELAAVAPVARKQDDAAGQRVREPAPVGVVESEAGDIEDDGCVTMAHRALSCSTTTKLAA